jgi:hypothetical protein
LPALHGLTGRKLGLPGHDIEGVHSHVVAESIQMEYPAVQFVGRAGCVSERKFDFRSAAVISILVDERASNVRLLSNGGLLLQDKYLLGAEIHPSAGIVASWREVRLPKCAAPNLVLPWAHPWWSFGDFMLHILPFLCRIWSQVPEHLKTHTKIGIYGISKRPFAFDYLQLLGIERQQIIDLAQHEPNVPSGGYIFTGSGVTADAYTAHPEDFKLVRSLIRNRVPSVAGPERLYVSRGGSRKYSEGKSRTPIETEGISQGAGHFQRIRRTAEGGMSEWHGLKRFNRIERSWRVRSIM